LFEEASRLANNLDLRLPNGGSAAAAIAAGLNGLRDLVN